MAKLRTFTVSIPTDVTDAINQVYGDTTPAIDDRLRELIKLGLAVRMSRKLGDRVYIKSPDGKTIELVENDADLARASD